LIQTEFLPWQTDVAEQWLSAQSRSRFAHAWLINGQAGMGKRHFAIAAAAAMLCEAPLSPSGFACGQCVACGWFRQGNHPDVMRVRPDAMAVKEGEADRLADDAISSSSDMAGGAEEPTAASSKKKSDAISIDQIRALEPWYNRATHRGGERVAVIYPAETLKVIAGNALLKALEEPPPHTVFLLVVDSPDALLPTIVSRCRRLTLPMPTEHQSLAWLQEQLKQQTKQQPKHQPNQPSKGQLHAWLALSGGAPIKAYELLQQGGDACPDWLVGLLTQLSRQQMPDVGRVADQLATLQASQWLDILQRVAIDLSWVANGLPVRYFPHLNELLGHVSGLAPAASWLSLTHGLTEEMRLAHHPLNAKLFAHYCLSRFCTTAVPK
jgi:DNA polymerase-3 subunit delta'